MIVIGSAIWLVYSLITGFEPARTAFLSTEMNFRMTSLRSMIQANMKNTQQTHLLEDYDGHNAALPGQHWPDPTNSIYFLRT